MTNEDGATTGDTGSIEPTTVTINTLRINGKQVTLAVFRQLKAAALINHDGSLAGLPWGMVNYHQKGCDKLEKHAHVVWQLDDQLRQDTIQPPRWEPYWSDTCDALVFAAGTVQRLPHVIMRGHNPVPPPSQDSVRPRRSLWSWLKFGRKSHREQDPVRPQEPVRPSLPEQPDRYVWSWPEFGHDGYRAGKRALIFIFDDIECSGQPPPDSWGGGPELAAEHSAADYAALRAQLQEEVDAERERRAKHEARWAEILDLPQLFIAV